jgi:predicted metal-dependent HD superfamily phosphohydrolase
MVMKARDLVSHVWNDLVRRHCRDGERAGIVLNALLAAYSEPNRHYHATEHIASLIRQLDEFAHAVADRDAVTLAILFHDVVYDPRRHDNEEKSAAIAAELLSSVGFFDEVVKKVESYVLATKHSQGSEPNDKDLALLLDLDLSTLAAAPADYRVYVEGIRREFAHVPAQEYRAGRRQILEGFLARGRIYRTEPLRALWEERARTNIAREIAELA